MTNWEQIWSILKLLFLFNQRLTYKDKSLSYVSWCPFCGGDPRSCPGCRTGCSWRSKSNFRRSQSPLKDGSGKRLLIYVDSYRFIGSFRENTWNFIVFVRKLLKKATKFLIKHNVSDIYLRFLTRWFIHYGHYTNVIGSV